MIKLEKLKISIQTEGLGYYMSVGWLLRKINFKIYYFSPSSARSLPTPLPSRTHLRRVDLVILTRVTLVLPSPVPLPRGVWTWG